VAGDGAAEGPPPPPPPPSERTFRGRAWFPRLYSLIPWLHAVRRSVRIDTTSSMILFGVPLQSLFESLPDLPKGCRLASSFVTNGYSISLPYLKTRTAKTRAHAATLNEAKRARKSGGGTDQAPAPHVHFADTAPAPDISCASPLASRPLSAQERVVAVDSGGTWIVMTLEKVIDVVTGLLRLRVIGLSTREWRALRGDDQRLATTSTWCANLAAPGGAFERLQSVSRKTGSIEKLRAYNLAAHGDGRGSPGAYADVLHERLKPRWAQAAFRTWSRGHAILEGFWARIRSGRLEDGTYGLRPVILFGKVNFSASGRGRHSSPTTAMRKACVSICGADWVRDANEHRSTKCCSGCHLVLDKVVAATPERIYAKAAGKAARPLPEGWTRPPARDVHPTRIVRGMLFCPTPRCSGKQLKHRDTDACLLMLENEFAVDAGKGTLPCMQTGRRMEELPAGIYFHWS
jgi:hypothetical protein